MNNSKATIDAWQRKLREEMARMAAPGGRGWDNCGWSPPRPGGLPWCGRQRRELLASDRCPCRHWVKRGRLDRIRGRVGR